jgi:rhodanese-related sulfurtransferase
MLINNKYSLLLVSLIYFLIISSVAIAQHKNTAPKPDEKEKFPFLTAQMVRQEISGDGKPVLIDVGSIQEYRGGHIPGAINIPAPAIKAQPQRLPKDKSERIIIYHGRGEGGKERAHHAATLVWNMGYTNVSVFLGGMSDWYDLKYPIKKGINP